jgi:enediyne biosynthesis protein E4
LGPRFGDLGGDGNLDIVYANYEKGVTILRNDCDSGHRVNVDLRGTVSNRLRVGATVRVESALGTQVRQLVLARGYMSSSEPMVHFGLGKDTTIGRLVVTWPSGHVQTFEHLAVDRRYTVTEPSGPMALPADAPRPPGQFTEEGGSRARRCGRARRRSTRATCSGCCPCASTSAARAWRSGTCSAPAATTSWWAARRSTPLRVLHSAAAGTFSVAAQVPAAAIDDGPILLFDSGGSGRPGPAGDQGGQRPAGGLPGIPAPAVPERRGRRLAPAPADALPPLLFSAGAVAAADFDHSGRLGLFIGGRVLTGQYPQAPQSALLANRGGRFEDVTDALAPGLRHVGMVTAALWSDVDGDGWPDLLVTLEWGNVKYFHNNQGKGFEDWTQKAGFASAGTGWWTSIAAADFNGDGRLDYVVGNVGLNTQYHADPEHPALLYSGDFKGDGSNQLIEAYYEGDTLYPWRSRTSLGASLPSVLKRFPTFDAYAGPLWPRSLASRGWPRRSATRRRSCAAASS